jgi:ribonucleoside-diphosphate reductase alpha chain
MAAAQPFISGAISKTVNMPGECTVEEVRETYIQAWKMGLKCVAIYRDGSKSSQPLNTKKTNEGSSSAGAADTSALEARIKELEIELSRLRIESGKPLRRRLTDTRTAVTHKFDIAGHEGYITVGLFEDGTPGELFLVMAKEGSTISGFADAFAQAISYALQYGVPLQDLVDKFSHVRFEPSGMTKNPDVRFAKSIVDYIFRWMAAKFLSPEAQFRAGVNNREELVTSPEQLPLDVAAAAGASATAVIASPRTSSFAAIQNQEDAPPCSTCGSIMVRSGSCYKCANCGTTSGCA